MLKITLNQTKIDRLILGLMVLQLVLLGFFGLNNVVNKLLTVAILVWVILQRVRIRHIFFLSAGSMVVLYVISSIATVELNMSYVTQNFAMQIYPFVYAYFFWYLCDENPDVLDRFIQKTFKWANLVAVMNIVVVAIQILFPGVIEGVHTVDKTLFVDTLSGLFEYSAAHTLCMYIVFVIIYNGAYVGRMEIGRKRRAVRVYNGLLVALAILLGLMYDNKAILLLLPVVWLSYRIIENRHRVFAQVIFCFGAISIGLMLCYLFLKPVWELISKFIAFNDIIQALSKDNVTLGSGERIGIIMHAFTQPSTYFLGKGWGSSHIYSEDYWGFAHFGQSDAGSILALGGIWYLIVSINYYYRMMLRLITSKTIAQYTYIKVAVLLVLLVTLLYTQPFTRSDILLCMILIILVFRMKIQDNQKAEEGQ